MHKYAIDKLCVFIALCIFPFTLFAGSDDETTPTIELGAEVFKQRCTLCHGSQGMGEGILPLKIDGYPNTNLLVNPRFTTRKDIHDVITHGLAVDGVSKFRPPMGQELTWTELESVVDFVMTLRSDKSRALKLLADAKTSDSKPALLLGREIFEARCALCHGKAGAGDGRMAKVIKHPPPYNLQKSVLPMDYFKLIVAGGGDSVGRSGQMPPWGQQLSESELEAVVAYAHSLRNLGR